MIACGRNNGRRNEVLAEDGAAVPKRAKVKRPAAAEQARLFRPINGIEALLESHLGFAPYWSASSGNRADQTSANGERWFLPREHALSVVVVLVRRG